MVLHQNLVESNTKNDENVMGRLLAASFRRLFGQMAAERKTANQTK